MGTEGNRTRYRSIAARLAAATALACVLGAGAPLPALSQSSDVISARVDPNAQMLLEADTLIYDNDSQTVTAVGGVQIEYDGNRLVAQRVSYDQRTRRLKASGNVEIIERDGNRIYADEIDITDDFGDGFVNALRVETTDNTRFAAESATRRDGSVTTFNQGIYTACEPCRENPEKPPLWQIKAKKIIWNGKTHTVRFEGARFEFFGLPLAVLPSFEIADPTIRRKTGFLLPGIKYSTARGVGVRTPFYFALHPTAELLVTPTYYTRQGFMGEAEFAKRFNNGSFSVKAAGINQQNPAAFAALSTPDTVSASVTKRGMVGTKGRFEINPRWALGWDILVQSDKNFSRTYGIEGYDQLVRRDEIYLTGLGERNSFDLRFMRFRVQEVLPDSAGTARNPRSPWVLPNFDYSKTVDDVAGGELNLDVNGQAIYRQTLHNPAANLVRGIGGTSGRVSGEVEWKRNYITEGGLVVTPLLAARADGIFANPDAASIAAINAFPGATVNIQPSYLRWMATAGLEIRWPFVFSTSSGQHVLEPVAQIFVRPNAPYQSTLGIPNEDAQSLVFDASTLFERDKFSGWDRIEGGTRANVGVRYTGSFGGGWTAHGLFGESFHLAGANPYAQADLVNVGAASGLETSRSDFVGMFGIASPFGLSGSISGRFDETTFAVRRAEAKVGYSNQHGSVTGRYTFIDAQPSYGLPTDRREVQVGGTLKIAQYWSTFASGTYDLQSKVLVSNSVGFAYDDECFNMSLTYSESRPTTGGAPTRSVGFNISLRTLGDFGSTQGLGK
ncbi:MAG: LPS-assembly protein LptD [Notoacmeibacter sp.]|nr:LPS-assembly protein LptD [Notoacmeibacter sp.]